MQCVRSAVSSHRLLLPIEGGLFEIKPVQHRAQHFVVDVTAVTLVNERLAFGGEHLQPQPAEGGGRAFTDLLVVATQPSHAS